MKPLTTALKDVANLAGQRLSVTRLILERLIGPHIDSSHKVMATACDLFPIYSHTFVYEELTQLARHAEIRLIYSKLDRRDLLQHQFDWLWQAKRRLFVNWAGHEKDYHHYRRRMPQKMDRLVTMIAEASGLAREPLLEHWNLRQAFTFTRMVEAYRPAYLHSYFFYDRSLMALVAGYLLGVPRGISCYADHMLQDYELKLVPLHLELCDIVVATSERIRSELVELAPRADHSRIVIKPNGIDTQRFPEMQRHEPAAGDPFRLIALCRIEPKKGLLDLVDAVGLLRSRGVLVEAHIVGMVDEWSPASRDYKIALDRRITELNLHDGVHFEGRQNLPGILRLLGMAHLFVAPFVETDSGDKDGIPTAVLEGMSTGLAVVATDAGSITEVINHERNGMLTPQRDPAALADAIASLLGDVKRRHQLGRHSRETVKSRFNVQVCERQFHERVAAVIAGRRELNQAR